MPPITDLAALLADLRPVLREGVYVFASVHALDELPAEVPVATVREREGVTVVLPKGEADARGISYEYAAAWITLEVPSALSAVGLTASVSGALAGAGISCNVIAGYHHDHLFVPAGEGARAVAVLRGLSVE